LFDDDDDLGEGTQRDVTFAPRASLEVVRCVPLSVLFMRSMAAAAVLFIAVVSFKRFGRSARPIWDGSTTAALIKFTLDTEEGEYPLLLGLAAIASVHTAVSTVVLYFIMMQFFFF